MAHLPSDGHVDENTTRQKQWCANWQLEHERPNASNDFQSYFDHADCVPSDFTLLIAVI